MNLDQAKAQVQLLLEAQPGNEGCECTIELWWGGKLSEAPACVGVRISEISFTRGTYGSSYMAGAPACLGVIAAAERCIIERMVCTCSDAEWAAEIADADWRLLELLNPKEPS